MTEGLDFWRVSWQEVGLDIDVVEDEDEDIIILMVTTWISLFLIQVLGGILGCSSWSSDRWQYQQLREDGSTQRKLTFLWYNYEV